jgi:nucleotide-binding universal stress UspA family protein
MSYQTLMVNLHIGRSNTMLLQITRELAERFQADVIGITVAQPTQMIYGQGYALMDFFNKEQVQIEKEVLDAEASFRLAFQGFSKTIEWRSSVTFGSMADYILGEACSADMLITGVSASDFYEGPNAVQAGEIIMQVGRPVLVVPSKIESLKLDNILVGWKDKREARRAIADALPLLKLATNVSVLEICDESEKEAASQRLDDVLIWLKRHGIRAEPIVSIAVDTDATQFVSIAQQHDLVVAGAYGHSRLREWVLGGVTDELLQRADFCSLLSH